MNNLKNYPIHRDIETLLEQFLTPKRTDTSYIETGSWTPPVDIKEEADKFMVIADLPGVQKEDIHISLEEHMLTLKGERRFKQSEQKCNYTRRERTQGQFYRRFSLPQTADDAKIAATYKHGVLEIEIPKKEPAVEKRIKIHVDD